jgi:Ca-activated chloride channel family protein
VTDEQVLEQARASDVGVYAIALQPATPRERERLSFMEATHFLNALARETGAQVLLPGSASGLDAAYARVAEELRTQYTLGYVSSNARRDGAWRRIVVRTPGRAELQLRHKLGYRAARR